MTRTVVVAEAGVNHNGSVEMAHRLIDVAKESGADVVKFQTFSTELVLRSDTPLVAYQRKTGAETMFDLVKGLELGKEDFAALKRHCDTIGIEFLSTAFDLPSLDYLVGELGMRRIKIPSGEAVNVPLLRRAGAKGLPIILSTGMCTLEEIGFALDTLRAARPKEEVDFTVLHCTTAYPTPVDEIHLRSMTTIRDRFGLPTGLSDHSEGFLAAAAAAAMGAVMIEKHFTLDRDLPGPDHRASVDPAGLKTLIDAVRSVEAMLGSGEKGLRAIERDTIRAVRRSLVAARDISAGETIREDDLVALRPEDGIPARDVDLVVGVAAWADFKRGEVLKWPAR
ncbi:N-acetylneuraminate synthase family protein [Methylocystis heyeri]|uniref:N-acetylneuraminate synthase n=1 Tax=Methylocystis heyeri TaxID=391905 RepID=A0A6B8KFI0_9HYPH|nr:N-acetylneuraminate synthase family protein [Methylocystis heyeri]QGM45243.1 N-acetylneuraminate synthase [Methylocystis heyeri]